MMSRMWSIAMLLGTSVLWSIAMILFVFGCPPSPKPTPLTAKDAAPTLPGAACSTSIDMGVPLPCSGVFTSNGIVCALCPVQSGCYFAGAGIWCVSSCNDPSCKAQIP
jgi:hypothetical protein